MAHARFFSFARLAGFGALIYGGGCVVGAVAVAACSGTTVGTGITSCEGGDCPATDPFASLRDGATHDPASGDGAASTVDAGMEPGPSDGSTSGDVTLGSPCERDVECTGGLCNLGTDTCEAPAPDGAKCWRDQECAGGLCNLGTDTCLPRQPAGQKCWRDTECTSGLCNSSLDTCQ